MSEFKNIKISPYIQTRDLYEIEKVTGNPYESIVIIAKRANQINTKVIEELREKLQEFGSTTDNLEEIHENVEQIEISKFYERMSKPTMTATQEFLEGKVYYRNPDKENNQENA